MSAKGILIKAVAAFIVGLPFGYSILVNVNKFFEPVMTTVGFSLSNVCVLKRNVPARPMVKEILFFGLIIGELALVGYISARINKLSSYNATLLFLAYTILNGLTMAVIFMAYTSESISSTFIITAGTFGVMSLYGYYTKSDLTKIGSLAFMALIGIIIASVVNMFMNSELMSWIISYLGVAIFIGLTAYDTQKLKGIAINGFENEESMEKSAILGALTLYLDFINLFLFLLRILGDRK